MLGKADKISFVRKMVAKIFKRKRGKIGSRKRGRPLKSILDLTERQREILLSSRTCREKAVELNMSVGWVARWEKCLRQEMKEVFSGLFTRRSQARSR